MRRTGLDLVLVRPFIVPDGYPDSHPFLLHFTKRVREGTNCDDPAVLAMDGGQRLWTILANSMVRAFPMFGTGLRAVCLTEFTSRQANFLIAQGVYEPWAIGLRKRDVFAEDGGPCLEVRGDEWDVVPTWSDALQARAKRVWPGADQELGERDLDWYLAKVSMWSFEREWRVPLHDLHVAREAVAFLVVPSADHRNWLTDAFRAHNLHDLANWAESLQYYFWDSQKQELTQGT